MISTKMQSAMETAASSATAFDTAVESVRREFPLLVRCSAVESILRRFGISSRRDRIRALVDQGHITRLCVPGETYPRYQRESVILFAGRVIAHRHKP